MPPRISSIIRVVPRSGWVMTRAEGTRPTANTAMKSFQPKARQSRASRRAASTSTASLASSDGWMLMKPSESQRLAP